MPRKAKGETKGEVVTLRLTPRTRYGLELLARQQRRPLSSVAEWAFHEVFKTESIAPSFGEEKTLKEAVDDLWDPLEPDRLVKLAQKYPSLLTYEEDLIWKVIKEEPSFWLKDDGLPKGEPLSISNWPPTPPQPDMKRIRRLWPAIKEAASGEGVDFARLDVITKPHGT
jgi:hypothetical protein